MRKGFCVRANACKCQASVPATSLRPPTTSRKLATLLTLATLLVNSSTSPDVGANPGAGTAFNAGFDELVFAGGFGGTAAAAGPASRAAPEFAAGGSGVNSTTVLFCPPACNHTNAAAAHITAKITENTETTLRLITFLRRGPYWKSCKTVFRRKLQCHASLLPRLRCFRLPEAFSRVLRKLMHVQAGQLARTAGSRTTHGGKIECDTSLQVARDLSAPTPSMNWFAAAKAWWSWTISPPARKTISLKSATKFLSSRAASTIWKPFAAPCTKPITCCISPRALPFPVR